ncbi:hypothetical protein HLH44_19425 [Gluconacetobacter sp. 1c LMG 22058]|uniref:Uncharacterized protein YtcA n=1 Tax=Gluconacetobacter dulcium TaxID=2729096 RepID=A0A7W4K3I2_9PROT|nr:YtcA family lipoprotein [Gluconacetobacter dulcium]MBB2199575.1 hypothetical protein [Gluconacetobacter dulcium]
MRANLIMQNRKKYFSIESAGLALPLFLCGCSSAPLQNVLGSFFPSWMICVVLGAVSSALLRALIGMFGMQEAVPVPMLTYLAFALSITFLIWLLVFGH